MDRVKLVVHPRDAAGSREARRLRRSGLIPAVLYGSGNAGREHRRRRSTPCATRSAPAPACTPCSTS